MRFIKLALLCACLELLGCTVVDNVMLGKDNAPLPTRPKQIDKQMVFVPTWQEKFSPRGGSQSDARLHIALSADYVFTTSASGYVQCRDKRNGKLVWQTNLNTGIASGPAVGDGVVALGGSDALLLVLSQRDGRLLWKQSLSNQMMAAPVVAHQHVFTKTIDGQLDAFDLSKGVRIWHYNHGAPEIVLKASSAPVIDRDRLYAGFSDGSLEAFDWRSGQLLWHLQVGYSKGSSEIEQMVDIDTTPLLHDGVIFEASYQAETVAVDAKDGRSLWQQAVASHQDMGLRGDHLFVVGDDGRVWAISTKSGVVLWQQQGLMHHHLYAPAVFYGGVIVADKNGYVHALNARHGKIVASQRLFDVPIIATVAVQGDDMYVLNAKAVLAKYTIQRL